MCVSNQERRVAALGGEGGGGERSLRRAPSCSHCEVIWVVDVDAFLRRCWGINSTGDYSRVSHNTAGFATTSSCVGITLNITDNVSSASTITFAAVRLSLLQPFYRSQWGWGSPDRGGVVGQSGGVSPTLVPSPCTQLSMPQPLSTSTALPAPLPCVDGQWHKVHRSPGSPPAPAADLLHSSSPSPSSSCFSCSDPPHPHPCPHRHQTLKRTTMHREGRLLTSSSHTRHLPHHPHRCTHPLRGCHGRPMCHRPPRRSSGATCGAATTIYKEMCAGGNCSPTRNSSFALTRKEKLTAPKVTRIHTVSQLCYNFDCISLVLHILSSI